MDNETREPIRIYREPAHVRILRKRIEDNRSWESPYLDGDADLRVSDEDAPALLRVDKGLSPTYQQKGIDFRRNRDL